MQNMKQPMKLKLFLFSLIALVGLSSCLINSKYHKANELTKNKRYFNAIKLYDEFIEQNPKSPYTTRSRLARSQCYYNLAKRAYNKENWVLAKRLFLLANNAKADSLLDNSIYEIATNKLAKKDTLSALEDFDYIVNNLKNSELLPQILFKRIELNYALNNYAQISKDYKYLWDNYPENKYADQALPYIDKILPSYLDTIRNMIAKSNYEQALNSLKELLSFPSSLQEQIKSLMAKTYYQKAEAAFENNEFAKAKQLYDKAAEQTDEYRNKTNKRFAQIRKKYLQKGNNLMQAEEFEQAIEIYEKIYIFDPQSQEAENKISTAEKLKNRKVEAEKLLTLAAVQEDEGNYKKALELHKKSNNFYQTKQAKQQIFEINNILRADKEPKVFAKDIIFEHDDGDLVKNVYSMQDSLALKHGKDEVRSSEWKVLYSFGKYKYEVRYDILTPEENYYFIWQIDLKNRKVSALNKLSEKML